MTASRKLLVALPVLLVSIGVILWALALLAPSIGLGEMENFILYKLYGWPRRQVFASGSVFISSGVAIIVVHYLLQLVKRNYENVMYMIGVATGKISSQQEASPRGVQKAIITIMPFLVSRKVYAGLAVFMVIAYGVFEYWTRLDTYESYVNNPNFHTIVLYTESIDAGPMDKILGTPGKNSDIGIFKENADITLAYLTTKGKLAKRVDFHLNNVGLISERDVDIERVEPEFRILVLGNEQTAPTTAEIPWPEIMNDLLNEDEEFIKLVGGKKINVINFGWPDAGFAHYPWMWERASVFKPDMVLMNIADHDFRRVWKFGKNRDDIVKKISVPEHVRGSYDYGPDVGFNRPIILTLLCLKEPVTLRNPTCTTSRPHGIFSPASFLEDKKATEAAHKQIIEEYAGGIIWETYYPLGLRSMFGYSMDPEALRGMYWPSASPSTLGVPTSKELMVDLASEFISKITDDIPQLLITRNAWYSELVSDPTDYGMTKMLKQKRPELDIRIMANYLPLDLGEKEIESWYYVPKDPVKWSDKGHHLYAGVIAETVKEYVRNGFKLKK